MNTKHKVGDLVLNGDPHFFHATLGIIARVEANNFYRVEWFDPNMLTHIYPSDVVFRMRECFEEYKKYKYRKVQSR